MAARARFSIGGLMGVVFLVALDLAIVRAFWDGDGPAFAVTVTTLPMINLLLLALPRLRRREARPYWVGFEVAGWSVVLLAVFLGTFHQLLFFRPMFWVDRLELFAAAPSFEIPFIVAIAVVLYTTPKALAAAIGGWLVARYRVVIERRPAATPEED